MNRRRFFIAGAAVTVTLMDAEAHAQDRAARELAAYAALSEAFMNLANSPKRPEDLLADRLLFRQHETACRNALHSLSVAKMKLIQGFDHKNCPRREDFPALEGAVYAIDTQTSSFGSNSSYLSRTIKPTDLGDAIYKASTDLNRTVRPEWPLEIHKYCEFSLPEKMAFVDRLKASSRASRQCEYALGAAARKVDP